MLLDEYFSLKEMLGSVKTEIGMKVVNICMSTKSRLSSSHKEPARDQTGLCVNEGQEML